MVIQVLNSKLGITFHVSVTSATILMAKRIIHKHGLNHGIMNLEIKLCYALIFKLCCTAQNRHCSQ